MNRFVIGRRVGPDKQPPPCQVVSEDHLAKLVFGQDWRFKVFDFSSGSIAYLRLW